MPTSAVSACPSANPQHDTKDFFAGVDIGDVGMDIEGMLRPASGAAKQCRLQEVIDQRIDGIRPAQAGQ
jgi:hypothetical protein